jgi:hypothetical protein
MRWLRGGDPEAQRRTALLELYAVLGGCAYGSATALKEKWKDFGVEQTRFSNEVYFHSSLEFLYFYLHFIDRAAFSTPGLANRDALIGLARDFCIKNLVSSGINASSPQRLERLQESAVEDFNRAQLEYGSCSEINATHDEIEMLTLGSIFGSFSGLKTDAGRTSSVVGRLSARVARVLTAELSLPLLLAIVAITGASSERMDLPKKFKNAVRYWS